MQIFFKNNRCIILTLISTVVLGFSSCKKFLDIDPPINQITAETAFSTDATASAAISGIYSRISSSGLIKDITPYTGLYSDELINYSQGVPTEFSISELSPASSPFLNSYWSTGYQYIYACNAALEKLSGNANLTPALQQKLTGEAKFIRAYIYLSLSNLFGDVPLITATAYEENSVTPRTPKSQVMQAILQDLIEAEALLLDKIDAEKIRANKWAAKALLARVYLYNGQFAQAESLASQVIESNKFILTSEPGKVFLKNSTEAILQFYPTQVNQNTLDGFTFLPASTNETPKYYVTTSLLNSFEPGDLRKSQWIGSRQFAGQNYFYPAKYKVINSTLLTEYQTIIRLAELYLVRAEARIQQGKITDGIMDLNILRRRARALPTSAIPSPLPDLDLAMSKAAAILTVEKERRIELMTEMGHRWTDIQRTKRADEIIGSLKPNTWKSFAVLWPIPLEQLRLNPSLTQNDGYTK